ncbi:MAG: outer membrane protein assembly factor BamA [Deltaproteobacteria bacterium]|nr:MAG: outer membrane protein assembly factor BamA [Deltaproteobacteria bacterium]
MIKRVVLLLLFLLIWVVPSWAADEYQIADIEVAGNRRVKADSILGAISLHKGQIVTPAQIDEAIKAVYRIGRFSDVTAQVETRGGVQILVLQVTERPLVRSVRFDGNKQLGTERLQGVVTLKVPDIYDPYEVQKSVAAIKAEYVKDGYYAAEITPASEINADNEALVTFRIDEGNLVRVKDLRFEGNTVFSERELRRVMDTQEKWMFSWLTGRGNYDEALLEQDLERIADQYFNQGYIRVKVRKPVISLVDDRRNMLILIQIDEGEQYRIGKLDAIGELIAGKDELLALLELRSGDVFSRELLRKGIGKISDLYADKGYAYVNVAPLTRADDATKLIDLALEIEQGPQVSVERINISGNNKTRDKVIRREIKLVEGDLFNASALKRSKTRINNLGFFETVDVTTSEGTDRNHINVDVNVKERSTGTFSVGAGYSSVDGFVGQGSVTQENFLGRGWKLNLAGSLGGESTTYQIGLTDPYFLDRNLVLGFELYKTEREWKDFSRRATGGAIKLGMPVYDEFSRALFVYRYEKKEIYDIDDYASWNIKEEEGSSTISSVTGTFTRDTSDYRLDPTKGGLLEASWELAGLGGTEKFSKYILDYRHFWPAAFGTVLSAHGQVGYLQALGGEEAPLDERFYLGGINTLRGFEPREVGPRDEDGFYTGATKEAFFNFEWVFPLVKDLGVKGVTFFDVGNAWGNGESFLSSWRYSVGAGIRWLSPLGPLRVEWGYNLDPEPWEDRSRVDFMIGRFF